MADQKLSPSRIQAKVEINESKLPQRRAVLYARVSTGGESARDDCCRLTSQKKCEPPETSFSGNLVNGVSGVYLLREYTGVEFMWNHNTANTLAQMTGGGTGTRVLEATGGPMLSL